MAGCNEWTVFEYLKHRTLATGHIPARGELVNEFRDVSQDDIENGIQEFVSRVSRWLRIDQSGEGKGVFMNESPCASDD
ncbi:hypothetical protein D3C87_993890 [compost metagenome]